MSNETVVVVVGTRPEVIKMAPVIRALKEYQVETKIWSTGQHREMLGPMLELFKIKPDIDLDLMEPNQTLSALTGRAIRFLAKEMLEHSPGLVLVQGDTTTAFAAALSSYYHQVPVGHVEAGLRTHSKYSPFPEEVNRALIGQIADLHFPSTTWARDNLLSEGVPAPMVHVVGNTVVDSLLWMTERNGKPGEIAKLREAIEGLGLDSLSRRFVLITGHRRENLGAGFESICQAIAELAQRFVDVDFVYPVHLNPRVREPVNRILGDARNVVLIEPVGYAELIYLLSQCTLVLTDSGGIQEEAPSLGKPVLIMRDSTERPEGVEAGVALLVGTDRLQIVSEVSRLLSSEDARQRMRSEVNPYGDGNSSKRIAEIVKKFIARGSR